ncbi:hypothetical protein B0H14DRAFT_3440828 [Mycena olivaceomarginata]|nr:hypothetical protein B0H14DRAFT_3440828 [Mycena olivaceomarginata]
MELEAGVESAVALNLNRYLKSREPLSGQSGGRATFADDRSASTSVVIAGTGRRRSGDLAGHRCIQTKRGSEPRERRRPRSSVEYNRPMQGEAKARLLLLNGRATPRYLVVADSSSLADFPSTSYERIHIAYRPWSYKGKSSVEADLHLDGHPTKRAEVTVYDALRDTYDGRRQAEAERNVSAPRASARTTDRRAAPDIRLLPRRPSSIMHRRALPSFLETRLGVPILLRWKATDSSSGPAASISHPASHPYYRASEATQPTVYEIQNTSAA